MLNGRVQVEMMLDFQEFNTLAMVFLAMESEIEDLSTHRTTTYHLVVFAPNDIETTISILDHKITS